MADTAAHLVDRVLPYAPYRQWVVTFSPRVRYHLAADPKLASLALTESLRAIFGTPCWGCSTEVIVIAAGPRGRAEPCASRVRM